MFCVRVTSKVLTIGFRKSNESNKSNISRLYERELFLTSKIQSRKDKRLKMVKEFLESRSRLEELKDKR